MPLTSEDTSTITAILKKIPLMEELNEAEHQEIIKRITLEYYPKNYTIFKEGDQGDAFFIIKRGMIRVFHAGEAAVLDQEVAMLSDNDFFGEMALIEDKPRNATVQTMEDSEVFKLKREDFVQLVSLNPNMASRISNEFLKRFKNNLREENS